MARIAHGSYTGNGASNRAITGLGFAPKLVLLGNISGGGVRWVKFSSFAGANADSAFLPSDNLQLGTAGSNNNINSLDADGFTISHNTTLGATNSANNSGATYYWFAIGGSDVVTGSYTGNGIDNRAITGLGHKPEFLWIKGADDNFPMWKSSSTGDASDIASWFAEYGNNRIQSLDADGFTVGTNASVNANGVVFYYVSIPISAGFFETGSYTGNGSDNRDITAPGFEPDVLIVSGNPASSSYDYCAWKTQSMAGDTATNMRLSGLTANWIQDLIPTGFQVGTATNANGNAIVYQWIAMRDRSGTTVGVARQNFEATLYAPAIRTDWTVPASRLNVEATVYAPTIVRPKTVFAGSVSAEAALYAPSIVIASNATVSPARLNAVATVFPVTFYRPGTWNKESTVSSIWEEQTTAPASWTPRPPPVTNWDS